MRISGWNFKMQNSYCNMVTQYWNKSYKLPIHSGIVYKKHLSGKVSDPMLRLDDVDKVDRNKNFELKNQPTLQITNCKVLHWEIFRIVEYKFHQKISIDGIYNFGRHISSTDLNYNIFPWIYIQPPENPPGTEFHRNLSIYKSFQNVESPSWMRNFEFCNFYLKFEFRDVKIIEVPSFMKILLTIRTK